MLKNQNAMGLVLKLMFLCYGYMLVLSSANVVNCELRTAGQCSQAWTQSFTVSGGIASTLWAYITDKPKDSENKPSSTRKRIVRKKKDEQPTN